MRKFCPVGCTLADNLIPPKKDQKHRQCIPVSCDSADLSSHLSAPCAAGDGTLFEYDEAERQWRERGRGEMRVNVGSIGKARLIMRNKGNFRLLLNANIWPGMKVTPMDGGKVRYNM